MEHPGDRRHPLGACFGPIRPPQLVAGDAVVGEEVEESGKLDEPVRGRVARARADVGDHPRAAGGAVARPQLDAVDVVEGTVVRSTVDHRQLLRRRAGRRRADVAYQVDGLGCDRDHGERGEGESAEDGSTRADVRYVHRTTDPRREHTPAERHSEARRHDSGQRRVKLVM